MTDMSCQTDLLVQRAAEDSRGLSSLQGVWIPLSVPHAGMVVRVRSSCRSGEEIPMQLSKGTIGSVTTVDKDGDATVYFPDLLLRGESSSTKVWVLREDFHNFERLDS